MATGNLQRTYSAPCPGCGAPVEFKSAQSTHAVCGFCRSTVVRSGEVLSRLGKMGEVFDDHSPLQLMATGTWQGKTFTLVGRLQYKSSSGSWTEWNALFDDGSVGTLGEDNGSYVLTRPATLAREVPQAVQFRLGASTAIAGKTFTVSANDQARLISAEGELPKLPPLNQPFAMVELRSADGEVLSVDYGTQPAQAARGRAITLDELAMKGLKDDAAAKQEQGRHFSCPHCGAPVDVALAASKAVTCRSCNSLIDLTQGTGGQLRHALQDEPVQPMIALGSIGTLQGVAWQVVGFQHRLGTEPDDPDEHFGWSEYLLYNRKRGFLFLVDASDGWSTVKPTTGAPQLGSSGQSATYLQKTYQLQYSYNAETTYVAGEFYWPVERGQKTFNRDFAAGDSLLSMEQSPKEITWSVGGKIDSDKVAAAFKLEGEAKDKLKREDAAPTSASAGVGCMTIIILFVIVLILLFAIRACTRDDQGSGYRSSGGSFGGYSSGGGHK